MKYTTRNYIRAEVERMPWPEIVPDAAGDLEREYALLRREMEKWRVLAVCALCVLMMIFAKWVG